MMRDDLMVQQQLPARDEWVRRWQHMVAVIMLNQTGRKQVKRVLPEFLENWPVPAFFMLADHEMVKEVIRPLGMTNIRLKRLFGMTQDYLTWDGNDATMLYGIGKYGSDSYRIFYKNEIPEDIGDHELKRYVEEELNGNLCTS